MKQDPTILEPRFLRARFCEIGSIIGSVIGAAGSLIGGSQAAGAAEDASDAQVRAAEIAAGVGREALGFQREMYDVGRADLAPYRASGAGALQTMNNMFLPGGHSMVQMQGQLNELRAQRARLMSGSGGNVAAPMAPQAPAISSPVRPVNQIGDRGGGETIGDDRQSGRDGVARGGHQSDDEARGGGDYGEGRY